MADWYGTGLGGRGTAAGRHTVPPLILMVESWYASAQVVARLHPGIMDDFNGNRLGAMAPDTEPREYIQCCALSLMGGPNSIHEFTMVPGQTWE